MLINYNNFLKENISNKKEIDSMIEYTIIKPNLNQEDVLEAINIIRQNNYYGIVIQPDFVNFTTYEINNDENIKIIGVLDFPDGKLRLDKKLDEANNLISNGVDEIDMSIDIEYFKEIYKKTDEEKNELYNELISDLKPIVNMCHKNGIVLKIIIEIGILSLAEIVDISVIIQKIGVDFVQTSSGMKGNGSELFKIKELRRLLPDYVNIKVAGGIRTYQQAKELLPYVDRIGTSAILK